MLLALNKEEWAVSKECGQLSGAGEGEGTPVFLPGEFHGQKSLVGYSPWDHKESDTTE